MRRSVDTAVTSGDVAHRRHVAPSSHAGWAVQLLAMQLLAMQRTAAPVLQRCPANCPTYNICVAVPDCYI